MIIIKIKSAEKTIKGQGEKAKVEHYGYWLTVKPITTSPFKFVISEKVYPLLYQQIKRGVIKEGTSVWSLIETNLT